MAINQINTAAFDYPMMLSVINLSYKTQHDITITNYEAETAPQVTAGSVFANNGAIFTNDALATPTGYAGIANSTAFYLYLDVAPTPTFIFSSVAPAWSDAKQGWYNGNDRAFFSMFKDSGGTLYQNKGLMLPETSFPAYGDIGSFVIASSNAWARDTEYLPGTTVAGNTLYVSTTASVSSGNPFSATGFSAIYTDSGAWQTLSLTGTWRLLCRVAQAQAGSATRYTIGMLQRIA